jgi:MYXO-CTERM domain-containing protein
MVRSLTAALVAACVAPGALGSIVVNGDFEEPVITAPFRVVPAGDGFITGWTVTAPAAGQGVDVVNGPAQGTDQWVNTGNQSIDMAGTPGRGSIHQDLVTEPGHVYRLSFWVSTNGGGNGAGLTIEWDGILVQTIGSPSLGTWSEHVYEVEASGALTRLQFIGNIDGNSGGTLLDTVAVVEVPTPGALALAGLVGVAAGRRRR